MAAPRGIPAGTQALDLSRNRLRFLAPGEGGDGGPLAALPGGLAALDLRHNPLLLLADGGLAVPSLAGLQRLALGGPELAYIGPQAFAGLGGLQQLTLEGGSVSSLPAQALSALGNLTVLRLRRLPQVGAVAGGSLRALRQLRALELDGLSSLGELGPDSLLGLNLAWLSVTRCNLRAVPHASLRAQAYLRFLNLSHNPIGAIGGGQLQHVTRLRELRLVGAALVTVATAAFRGLVGLQLLDVSANRLSSLEEAAFRSAASLQALGLGANPLACDCRLLWLVRRARRLRWLGWPPPACASPERLRGRRLTDPQLPRSAFSCRPPKIRLKDDEGRRRVRAGEGQTAILRCAADGRPPPAILWLNPRRQPLAGVVRSGLPTAASGPGVGRSRLLPDGGLQIGPVLRADAGTYRCVARNAGGNDTAWAELEVRPLTPEERLGLLGQRQAAAALGLGSPLEPRTVVTAASLGLASFLGVVTLCFSLLFAWSRVRGPIRHNTHIDFVPHGGGGGGGGDGGDAKFNMKMV